MSASSASGVAFHLELGLLIIASILFMKAFIELMYDFLPVQLRNS